MHRGKSRVMFNDKAQHRVIRVDNKALEVVEEYNYLRKIWIEYHVNNSKKKYRPCLQVDH